MLTDLLHKIAAHPWVYDWIQTAVGNKRVLSQLSKSLARLNPTAVLDIGGGTGTVREILPRNCRYICLDSEMPKLRGFRAKAASGMAVLGDATAMPIAGRSVDLVICKSVTHHLTDPQLEQALSESRRVLRPGGHLLLLDAVLDKDRLAGRVLWSLDRGSYPRSEDHLRKMFVGKFRVATWEKFAIFHQYVLAVAVRADS